MTVCVAEAGAIFAFAVSLLSAEFTGQRVVGLPVDQFRAGVPPCISAPVRTEIFRFSSGRLSNAATALPAVPSFAIHRRMPAQMRPNCVY